MCRLFETIRVVNGVPQHLAWHERRMNQAGKELWNDGKPFLLSQEITVPPEFSTGLVQCNIFYGPGEQKISFKYYRRRVIRSLKMVECNSIDYHLKYSDRSLLESLFMLRGGSDDVIIVKNGLITDTLISNLIFLEGKDWYTPANPLLKGTCRNRLLSEGRLTEREIRPGDIGHFTGCKLINAMRDPEEDALIPATEIT